MRWRSIVALGLMVAGCGAEGPPRADRSLPPPVPDRGLEQPGPVADQRAGDAAPPVTDRPAPAAAVSPAQPGPFAVGVRTVTLVDPARQRKLTVDLWYPVTPQQPDGKPNAYSLELLFLKVLNVSTPARRDATPLAGARPLLLFSHGYGGVRFQSYFLTEHLASHGFLVAAPDHPGNTLGDMLQLGSDAAALQSAKDRPLDLVFVLERLLAKQAGVPLTVDPQRVAASGHSFGGWTALEVARRDARVRAVLALAPGFRKGATPDFVAGLARPVALFGGSLDKTCPFDTDQLVPYQKAQPPKILVKLLGAGHLDFSDLCQVPLASMLVKDGCNAANMPLAEVHARVKTLGTAFLRRHLLGDGAYEPYLAPGYATALGQLDYWRAP